MHPDKKHQTALQKEIIKMEARNRARKSNKPSMFSFKQLMTELSK